LTHDFDFKIAESVLIGPSDVAAWTYISFERPEGE